MNTPAYSLSSSYFHSYTSRPGKYGTKWGGTALLLFLLVPGSWASAQTTPGARGRPLTFSDNAANSLPTVSLAETLSSPVTVSPARLTFASGAVGTKSGAQTVTLTNHLNTSLPVSTMVATGDFAVASNTCGSSLGPRRSCTVGVTFRPTVVGVRTGTLTLPYRASGSPSVIPLSGAGNANGLISLVVTPANPSIAAGNTQQFTATGHFRGGSTQNLTASVLWNSSAPGVATITAAGLASSVAPGSTTISATWVTITPEGRATRVTPDLPIINSPPSNISGSTTLTVTGAPGVSLSTTSLTFGNQDQGTTSSAQSITLTNTGNASLTITSIMLTGSDPGDFTLTTTGTSCPYGGGSVAASGTCTINVTFTPTASGTRTASVNITDNAAGSPQTVSLTGMGAAPLYINTRGELPDATVGIPYSVSVNVTGGTGPYTWSIVSGGGPLPSCLSLAPGRGLISGTPVNTCLGSSSFTVMVTDADSVSVTQPLSINVNPAPSSTCESGNESVLLGQYAFSLIGYNGSGFLARIGSFIADGHGNITGGEFDRNKTGSSPANFTLTASTYTVGADNRGCATFAGSGGSFSTRFVLGSTSSGTATQGRIIEFDPANSSAFIATGQLFQQTTSTTASASSFSALSGGYVHLLTGWDTGGSGGRIACDGVKTDTPTSGGAGTIASGEQYCNDEGVAPTGPTTALTGSYTGVDNYGRFTEIVGPTALAGYMVSTGATGALEVSTSVSGSNTTILAGQEYLQSGTLSLDSTTANGNLVGFGNGVNSTTTGKIYFALANASGTSLAANPYYENDGGTWTANGTTSSCTYTVASNGGVSGCGGMMYLTAPNTAVVVGNDAGGFAGYLMPQTVPTGGFTNVSGAFFGATSEIINQNAEADDDLVSLSTSGGALSGTDIGDESATDYQQADEVGPISGATLGSNGIITASKHGSTQPVAVAIDQQHFLSPSSTGCSGSSTCYPTIEVYGPSTADTVAVTINGSSSSSASVRAGTTLTLTVAVTDGGNAGVTWTVNGLPSGSGYTGYGTITGTYPSFTYTPPTRVPMPATFSITATSNADISQSASVSVTITAAAAPSPLSITTMSLPSGTQGSEYIQSIQTSGGTLPISWSVTSGSPPPGIFLPGVGTPNGVELIQGMPTATGTYNFTVTAKDSSSSQQTASQPLSITINPAPLSIITPTSLPSGTVGASYAQSVEATGGTLPYTWSYTGSLPPGLSWNTSTGAYWVLSGTPTTAGTYDVMVTVTDSTTPTHQTVSHPFAITINSGAAAPCTDSGSESLLSGLYAFTLSGFNPTGYLVVVGSITVDGSGHITAGEADTNGALGYQSSAINTSSSSYSVGSNNLGCATIVTSFGTFNTRLSLGTFVSSVATAGRMVEWDAPTSSTYFAATGQIQQQTAADFSSGLSGSYAFENSGVDSSSERVGVVGVLSVSDGSITAGEFDVNDAGTTANGTGATGTYTSADSNGRLTLSLTWSGQSSPDHSVFYMVSNSQLLFITTDALTTNGVQAGQMQQQTVPGGGFGNSSLDGNEVLYMTGLNGGGTGGSANLVILSADGNDNLTGTSYYDGGGTWKSPQAISCTYSIDTSGRMTCGSGAPVFYLTAANKAVVMSLDTDVADGQLVPQVVPGSGFTSASIAGTFYMGDLEVVNQAVNTGVGVMTLNSSGGISGVADYTATSGQTADEAITGTITVNSDGTFSTIGGAINAIFISSTKFVAVDFSSNTYPIINVGKQ